MTAVVAVIAGVVLAAAIFGLVRMSRDGRVGPRTLLVAALVCLAGFILMNISDWPTGLLAPFWRDHAIIAATAGTLLLVGAGYFAFEARDRQQQDEYDAKIAGTGRAGVVDHLVDIDVTLALTMGSLNALKHQWPTWDQPGRPLRWLRENRLVLHSDAGTCRDADPRARPVPASVDADPWRRDLVDQALRRIMSGIRDWSVVFGRSRAGQRDLVELGQLRLDLLAIDGLLSDGAGAAAVAKLVDCQARTRRLAYRFERESGAQPRSELLTPEGGSG